MDRFLNLGKRRVSSSSADKPDCECSSSTDSEKDLEPNLQSNKKKSKISHVWKYFKRSDDKKYAKCLDCGKEYKTSGNTSNLHDHLKRFHPGVERKSAESSTQVVRAERNVITSTSSSCRSSMNSVASYFKRAVMYDSNSKRKTETKALTEMVAKDVQPYNIVENEGFVQYTHVLDPRYKLPSKTHLRDVLMHNYFTETSAKLSAILVNVSNIAVTCDLWTSSANASFLTVTGHFVYNYELKTASLATKKLLSTTNYCSQNIADTLRDIFIEWNILEKTVCIVTDNASSMLKACDLLHIRNLPCFAHTINLVVQDALKVDDPVLQALFTKCKSIVRFFKQSTISNEKLKLAQEGSEYTLLQETPTRWNSFYFMIERIIKCDAIAKFYYQQRMQPIYC
ncbi:E3 SUMO-protein ligase ZBED1-like [Drosophila sulfurigaster albostrigata]|uniref:E3 SUMO-protein ligase ZBED1-like n=1 Tax=Drosophila sulfurigaster albostrigata TaxID=89887 RepID=UPI002D21E9DB|nr:E3 SUMO-protein ligase ZBED1-like [Drosophila sulfurigaster albostrigata]